MTEANKIRTESSTGGSGFDMSILRGTERKWGALFDLPEIFLSSTEAHEPLQEDPRSEIWLEPELYSRSATANLDDQIPATIYFLGRIVDIPEVKEVYVEELETKRRKHWTVIDERDYDVMEQIYEIEKDTKTRFSSSNISFRVTVRSADGPTVSQLATKVYDAT